MKWEGFDDSHNTWEPKENMNCPTLVTIYEGQQGYHKKHQETGKKVAGKEEKAVMKKKEVEVKDEKNVPRKYNGKLAQQESRQVLMSFIHIFFTLAIINEDVATTSMLFKNPWKKRKLSFDASPIAPEKSQIKNGFGRGLEPEKIVGATKMNGELQLLIKWKYSDLGDLVLAREANKKCPAKVIEFYESRMSFKN